jgi:very-short-patch-repair endonuclease
MRPGQRPDLAREFRVVSTEPEARLWRRLRRGQLDGRHFRRQVPIGPYIADFACASARLVVEIDGETHATSGGYDAARSAFLQRAGWRVIRFWNNEVMGNIDGVVEGILEALRCPLPGPPPRAGEGE